MGLNFAKKATKKTVKGNASKTNAQKVQKPNADETQAPEQKSSAKPSFLKTGKAAQKAQAAEEKKQEARQNEVRRFWLNAGQDGQVTFLSGDIVDGVLEAPMWYEHNLYLNGNWGNFVVCISEEEPCPMCEGGSTSNLMAGFTIIDHTPYEVKKGKNKGKVYKNQIKILVCYQKTYKLLQKLAIKRDGLVGATFDVSRTDKNAVRVGDVFDYVGKTDLEELQVQYGSKDTKIEAIDFSKILTYMTRDELMACGYGNVITPEDTNNGSTDYSKDL